MILSERARIIPAFGRVGLVPEVGNMTWEQAIAMEEFSEPVCFTTELFLGGIERLAAQARRDD